MKSSYSEISQNNKYGTQKHRPTRTQLRLLNYIEQGGGADGICLSKQALAHDLSCSTKTIDRGIAHLCALGLIEVEARHLSNGRQTANLYRINKNAQDSVDRYCLKAESLLERV